MCVCVCVCLFVCLFCVFVCLFVDFFMKGEKGKLGGPGGSECKRVRSLCPHTGMIFFSSQLKLQSLLIAFLTLRRITPLWVSCVSLSSMEDHSKCLM